MRRLLSPSHTYICTLLIWRVLLFDPLIGGAYNHDRSASSRIHRCHLGFLGGAPIVPRGVSSRVTHAASPPVVHTMVAPLWRRGQAASTLLAEPEMEVTPVAGRPHTPESRAKISAANKGKEPWNKGRRHSEETKARIRERTKQAMEEKKKEKLAKMGLTIEQYEQMKKEQAATEKARKREARRNATDGIDYKVKLSQRMRERWQNPEYRAKALKHLNESRAQQTEETRRKISQTMKKIWEEDRYSRNRTMADETRAKISAKLKEMYADPEYKSKLSTSRRRDPEHNRKIAEAIRKKWADESYKNKTLSGIHVYQSQYQEARTENPEKYMRRRSNTTSSRPRAPRKPRALSAAKRKALLRVELQELERMDREMRGEIKSRKATPDKPITRKKNVVSELMAKQAKDVWDQIYSNVSPDLDEEAQLLDVIRDNLTPMSDELPSSSEPPSSISSISPVLGEKGTEDVLIESTEDGAMEEGGDILADSESLDIEEDESDVEWKKYMEKMAKADEEDAELKKQRKAVRQRFLEVDPSIATDVFQLVDGKVAVTSAQQEGSPSSSTSPSSSPAEESMNSNPDVDDDDDDDDDDDVALSLEDKGPLDALTEASYVSSFPVLDDVTHTPSSPSSVSSSSSSSAKVPQPATPASSSRSRVESGSVR